MPPKVKVTKQEIIHTAVDIVRKNGPEAMNAREVAKALGCSTQPVFSNFATMEELKLAVVKAAEECYREYIEKEMAEGKYPPYKATGMAYIRFAREERELFKLLYMRDRTGEKLPEQHELTETTASIVQKGTGFDRETAQLLHLEMWAFVHGIATIVATNYMTLEDELISRMLTDAYQGLKKRFAEEA